MSNINAYAEHAENICPIYPGKGTLAMKHISTHCKLHKMEATRSPIIRYYEEIKSMSTGDAYQFLRTKSIKFRTDKRQTLLVFQKAFENVLAICGDASNNSPVQSVPCTQDQGWSLRAGDFAARYISKYRQM